MKQIHYTLYREGSDYVAQGLDVDVSSFGATPEEAVMMLKEAVELYFEDEGNVELPKIDDVQLGELAIA